MLSTPTPLKTVKASVRRYASGGWQAPEGAALFTEDTSEVQGLGTLSTPHLVGEGCGVHVGLGCSESLARVLLEAVVVYFGPSKSGALVE